MSCSIKKHPKYGKCQGTHKKMTKSVWEKFPESLFASQIKSIKIKIKKCYYFTKIRNSLKNSQKLIDIRTYYNTKLPKFNALSI